MKIVGLMVVAALLLVFAGCVQNFPSTASTPCPPYTYNSLETSAPLCDTPASEPPRKYTGIIKNKTAYEVSVPSGNSGATLIIPARGWIEYTSYERHFDLTAYHAGKPFYCMKINADPRDLCLHVRQIRFHGGDRQARTEVDGPRQKDEAL